MMQICNDIIVNIYLAEINIQDVRSKCSEVEDTICQCLPPDKA